MLQFVKQAHQLDLVNERNDQLKLFCYSFIFWMTQFGLLQEKLHHFLTVRIQSSTNVNNRIVSIVHGQFCLWLSFYYLYMTSATQETKNGQLCNFIMIVSAAYFTYDIIICLYYDLYDYWLILHHFASIVAYSASILTGNSGYLIIIGLYYAELPNLPMHVRVILREYGLRHTKLHELMELLYFFLFIFFRGPNSLILMVQTWIDYNASVFIQLMGTTLTAQTFYYTFEMIKIMKKKRMQYIKLTHDKITYYWFSKNPLIDQINSKKYDIVQHIL